MTIKHLYVHVPFCSSICGYCDFCHLIYREKLADQWLEVFEKELNSSQNLELETIYIGGGTPSALNINQTIKLLELLKPYTGQIQEYTIEINPENFSSAKAKLYYQYGINRASIGLQSANLEILKILNRKHSFKDVEQTVNILRKNNISNISIDIMYSLPSQTLEILKDTLDQVIALPITHISLYSLTIEDNTPFKAKGYQPLNDEVEADMYEYIVQFLTKHNYIQYEIANFCLKGYESKHNLGYWHYNDFLGLSLSSSSKIGNIRYDNTRSLKEYLNDYNQKKNIVELSKEELMFEHLMMNLRLSKGLNINDFNQKYQIDLLTYFKDALNKNMNNLLIENNYLRCKNLALLNEILLDFLS